MLKYFLIFCVSIHLFLSSAQINQNEQAVVFHGEIPDFVPDIKAKAADIAIQIDKFNAISKIEDELPRISRCQKITDNLKKALSCIKCAPKNFLQSFKKFFSENALPATPVAINALSAYGGYSLVANNPSLCIQALTITGFALTPLAAFILYELLLWLKECCSLETSYHSYRKDTALLYSLWGITAVSEFGLITSFILASVNGFQRRDVYCLSPVGVLAIPGFLCNCVCSSDTLKRKNPFVHLIFIALSPIRFLVKFPFKYIKKCLNGKKELKELNFDNVISKIINKPLEEFGFYGPLQKLIIEYADKEELNKLMAAGINKIVFDFERNYDQSFILKNLIDETALINGWL